MLLVGYRPSHSQTACGQRIVGYKVYALEEADGVTGSIPVEFFISTRTAEKYGIVFSDELIGAELNVDFDVLQRVKNINMMVN